MTKNKTIYFIAWYFPSFPGGAEYSIFEELKKYKKKNFNIKIISFDEYHNKGKFSFENISGENYGLKYNLSNFSRFTTLSANKKFILKKLNENLKEIKKSEFVITQSLGAPIIADFCKKNNIDFHYYLRDENNLNEFHNYQKGSKKIVKAIKDILDSPFRKKYSEKNINALYHSKKIFTNSNFMSKLLEEKFNLKSEVVKPNIDFSKLKKSDIKKKDQKYITFIGGHNSLKGHDIVIKIAKKMPDEKFIIIGRYDKIKTKKNITYLPFTKNVIEAYKKTKILLVPSRWQEAFGRIVLEANHLGIKTITSNRGGLPEANQNKNLIIKDFENIDLWVKKIKEVQNEK